MDAIQAALETLRNHLQDGDLFSEWNQLCAADEGGAWEAAQESIAGKSCLLVRSAVAAMRGGGATSVLAYGKDAQALLESRAHVLSELSSELPRQAASRLAVIRALVCDSKTKDEVFRRDLQTAIASHCATFDTTWSWDPLPTLSGHPALSRPDLPPACLQNVPSEIQAVFTACAEQSGQAWLHPGLQDAVQLAAALLGPAPDSNATAQSWVLFAGRGFEGYFPLCAELTMNRIPGGSGLLMHDCHSAGYLQLDSEFQEGVQRALLAVRSLYPQTAACDWLWSLQRPTDEDGAIASLVGQTLEGPSASAAFGCAVLALHPSHPGSFEDGDPLDPHVAVTAAFADIRSTLLSSGQCSTDLAGAPAVQLTGVAAVDVKTLGHELERLRLTDIVLAENHAPDDIPNDKRFKFDERAGNLLEAYELMSRWQRMTTWVKAQIIKSANTVLQDPTALGPWPENPQEEGYPFVPSPLMQIFPEPQENLSSRTVHSERLTSHELTVDERKQFMRGEWRPKFESRKRPAESAESDLPIRIFLRADSGYGKSILLTVMEGRTAQSTKSKIPLRIGRTLPTHHALSEFNWSGDSASVLRELYDRVMKRHLQGHPFESQGFAWFQRVTTHGDTVFLLDALDDTRREALAGLGSFLNDEPELRHCPVVLAGRPEAYSNRSQVFCSNSQTQWAHVRILPLAKWAQKAFVGRRLQRPLFPPSFREIQEQGLFESDSYDTDQWQYERKRATIWEELCGTPMLLKLIRDLARNDEEGSSGLSAIRNRYELYTVATEAIIRKAVPTLEEVSRVKRTLLLHSLNDILGDIAWRTMIANQDSAELTGHDFYQVLRTYGDLIPNLYQINLLTDLFERTGTDGIAWRHKSFCEFFAGRYMVARNQSARHENEEKHGPCLSASSRRDILARIHCSDSDADCSLDWDWTFRFALCHAATSECSELAIESADLALELLQHGNPWVVYTAMTADGVEVDGATGNRDAQTHFRPIREFTHYLVERVEYYPGRAKRKHRKLSSPYPRQREISPLLLDWWKKEGHQLAPPMLSLEYRESTFVDSLLELMSQASGRKRWTPDSYEMAPSLNENRMSLPQFYLKRIDNVPVDSFVQSFVDLPEGRFLPSEYPASSAGRARRERPTTEIAMHSNTRLSRFFVENRLFEVYCPQHKRFRNPHSRDDDSPAVAMNLYMARAFCEWLTRVTEKSIGGRFRLPTTWEFEWAVRWGGANDRTFWWGDEFDHRYCWIAEKRGVPDRTRSRRESETASTGQFAHQALLDPVGNIFCLCASPAHQCLLSGCSFDVSNPACAESSYSKMLIDQRSIFEDIGFRVLWEPETAGSPQCIDVSC